jgi:hypothetical protein
MASHGKQQVWLSKSQPWAFYDVSRGLSPAKNWKDWHRQTKDRCQKKVVPNKFHKPLASDLWLNSQTDSLSCNKWLLIVSTVINDYK